MYRPVDSETGERIKPSEFECHRRTHGLLAPCCLCAIVEGRGYTETRIGVAETVTQDLTRNQSVLNGEIVAVCGKQQCGYFRERFSRHIPFRAQPCSQFASRGFILCAASSRVCALQGVSSIIREVERNSTRQTYLAMPLPPTDVLPSVRVDDSFRAGDGLFQVMTDAVIRGTRNEGEHLVLSYHPVLLLTSRFLYKASRL